VRQRRFGSLACLLPAGHDRPDVVQAVVEGVAFSAIDLDTYKTADRDTTPLGRGRHPRRRRRPRRCPTP
jgi:hypothetical protein